MVENTGSLTLHPFLDEAGFLSLNFLDPLWWKLGGGLVGIESILVP